MNSIKKLSCTALATALALLAAASPVITDWSMDVSPETTMPSTGIVSPESTRRIWPISILST